MVDRVPEIDGAVMRLAQEAIQRTAEGAHAAALPLWEEAARLARAHRPGTGLDHWAQSGYGVALLEMGRHRESIAVLLPVGEWLRQQGRPLGALALARAFLGLGQETEAAIHLREAHGLIGDRIFTVLDPDWHPAILRALDPG